MPYLTYQGKRVQSDHKYAVGASPIIPIFSGWTNASWDTFTSSGINITSAIDAGGISVWADSDIITLVAGQQVFFKHYTTVNSGTYPGLDLMGMWNTYSLNLTPATNGIERSFPILTQATDNYKLRFHNISASAANCSCTFEFYLKS